MSDFVTPIPKMNRKLDVFAWSFTIGFILLMPFISKMLMPSPLPKGPVFNPTVLILFLGFLSLIMLSSLSLSVVYLKNKITGRPIGNELTQTEHNLLNLTAKFIGGLFIVSGFVKLQDITGFAYKLDDYWRVFGMDFMKSFSVYMAWFVSVFEVAIAFALMTGYWMRVTSFFLLGMILFFTFLTGYATFDDSLTDCGCFGDALKLEPVQSFMKDILLTIAIIPLYLIRGRIRSFYRFPIPGVLTYGSFLIFGYISYYCYQHLPLIDFRGAYKAGQNVCYNANNADTETGEIYAHDFTEFCSSCSMDGCGGATLYVVMYSMEKIPAQYLDRVRDLEVELASKVPGIKICGGSNTGSSIRDSLVKKHSLTLCISPQDEKVLQTMSRSSPGFIFLKDGVVIKKWHINDTPSADELKTLAGEYANQPRPVQSKDKPENDQPSEGDTLDSSAILPK